MRESLSHRNREKDTITDNKIIKAAVDRCTLDQAFADCWLAFQ